MESPEYRAYRERYESAERRASRGRKPLELEDFERLHGEYDRLLRRMDPDDIQLDEWKRLEELRFLLIVSENNGDE